VGQSFFARSLLSICRGLLQRMGQPREAVDQLTCYGTLCSRPGNAPPARPWGAAEWAKAWPSWVSPVASGKIDCLFVQSKARALPQGDVGKGQVSTRAQLLGIQVCVSPETRPGSFFALGRGNPPAVRHRPGVFGAFTQHLDTVIQSLDPFAMAAGASMTPGQITSTEAACCV